MDDPIVNGFIAESGTAFILDTPSLNYTGWYNISETLGCGGAEAGEETVQCLRGKNATDIITTVGTGNFSTTFTPVADDKVVFADVRNRSEAGQFIKKVRLFGSVTLISASEIDVLASSYARRHPDLGKLPSF